ncbi:MAG: nuclear transport factor 2 family protein [Gemmatimonadaceae bacterium]|nr:nuclear transport factor 2 family protein [Gemmatimonadaceae bacterium]
MRSGRDCAREPAGVASRVPLPARATGRAGGVAAVLLFVAPLLLAVGAQAQGTAPHPAATPKAAARAAAEIRAARARSNEAIARHDTAGIGAILAPHLVVVSSNSSQSIGRQAMLDRFAEQFASRPDVTYRRSPRDIRVFAPWEMAAESGTWTGSWRDSDGAIAIGGSYYAKWRRIDGTWFVESETFVPEYCRGGKYCAVAP